MSATTELRDMLDAYGIEVTLHRPMTKAELARENRELRELVARVERARRNLCDAYPDAELLNCEDCPAWSACKGDLMDRMRELGIEVD